MSLTVLQEAPEVLHSAVNLDLEEFPQFDLREQVLPHDAADCLEHRHQVALEYVNEQRSLIRHQLVLVLLFHDEV